MRPKSLSASSLNVASLCLARYKAENIDRAARPEMNAASLGTACHAALEMYVKAIYLQGKKNDDNFETLKMFFYLAFQETFGETPNPKDETYKDGIKMLQTWFDRRHETVRDVISCEVKSSFAIKTSVGPIPLNYIWDRFDKTGENEYSVIDYKTSVWDVTPEELYKKVQARVYGLAAQMEHPEAERIWVKFDMLRHGMVGVVFTKDDNRETYKWIRAQAERIISTDRPRETLNAECRFCVRRNNCGAIATNLAAGGIATVIDKEDDKLTDVRAQIEYAIKAAKINLDDIDKELLQRAQAADATLFDGEAASARVVVTRRRNIDGDRVRLVVGDNVFLDYGGVDLTLKQLDELLKDPRLTESQSKQIKGLIFYTTGEPYIKSKAKDGF